MIRFYWLPTFVLLVCFACHKKKDFPYGPPPIISTISPDSGHFGTVLTLIGKYFDSVASGNTVLVDSVPATVLYASGDSLVVAVPTTYTGHVIVQTIAGSATAPIFTYTSDVLLSGVQNDFTNGPAYGTALYWDNGVAIVLTDGGENAAANCITASGADIYVGGYEYYGRYRIAKIWKNGVATSLSNLPQNAEIKTMELSGNDIYAAGYVNNGSYDIAALWKNGNLTLLADSTSNSYVTSMTISSENIYLCGYQSNATQTKFQALTWKNGQLTRLTDSTVSAQASTITVSGNDVYIGGSLNSRPIYWKNGMPFPLSVPYTYYTAFVNSIALSGNNLLMVGYAAEAESFTTPNSIESWTSGPAFPGPPSVYGSGEAIVVDSNDVYVAGEELTSSGYYKVHYWKNGTDSLQDKGAPTVNSSASGIFIRH
jgi:hypothetical protein